MSPAAPALAPRARSLRTRLLMLAASGLLPLLLLLTWGIDHLFQERSQNAHRTVLELSRALGTAVDTELRSVEAVLQTMATSDELESGDLRTFYMTSSRAAAEFGWQQVILIDADGHVLMRTVDPFGAPSVPPVDMPSLRQVIETHSPAVGRVVAGFKGIEGFAVRVPVMRSGKLVYVLTAVLPTDVIINVLRRQKIPEGSIASVFDQTQHRVARSRTSSSPKPAPSLAALLDRGESQGTGVTTTLEGVESYTGYTRLARSRWIVAVGTSVAEVNHGLFNLMWAILLGSAASLGLSALLAWELSRRVLEPVEALKDAALALGRGGPVKPPPMDTLELAEVATALENAAADRDRAMEERERLIVRIRDALRQAEEANLSKDQFMAMLGHELRNPLAPITTAVQVMALKGDSKTAHERRIIERQLVHVTRLVDDLLDVSRITSRRLAIRREPVRLEPLLEQVVETIRPSLYQRELSLHLESGFEAAWVAGDEVRLVQVVNNLLVNAIKFTPPGGSIRVTAAVEGSEAVVRVEDSGAGIAQVDLERIFDLFYQAPQSSDRSRGGLGLGLPIVRSLVEMQGGTVKAESEGDRRGSRFTVRLPLCDASQDSSAVGGGTSARGSGKVLIVDDNEDAADTCAALLQLSGYAVRTAYTPAEAMEVIAGFRADLVILDIGLPGMNGYQLAEKLKTHGYRGRLVALTGYGQASDRATSQQQGFDVHLTKPVSPEELLEVVARMITTEVVE